MHFTNNKHFFIYVALLFASCRKDEIPVTQLDRGEVKTCTVTMGPDYKQQVFFSLSAQAAVASQQKTDWDLAFDCSAGGFLVRINTSKAMNVFDTGMQDLAMVTDTNGLAAGKRYDMPSGHPDSTAIGNWRFNQKVYVIDRGFNQAGLHQGYKKIKISGADADTYQLQFSSLDGSNEARLTLLKNASKNFIYLSFNSNSMLDTEPEKENYDLLFSQYTHIYTSPFQPYLVTGVLINPYRVAVARVSDKKFDDIQISDTVIHPMQSQLNVVGFDWKTYDFQSALYVVDAARCYIIRDTKGFYYKLHFIDFYDNQGQKGSPKFEFQKL